MDATMVAQRRKGALALVVTDIVDLLVSQPPQALMSTASIAIVAGEAAHMVPFPANIALAVGAEWAYLRGIASSPKGAKGWTRSLNWGALALVVLYGLLYGARKFGADPEGTFGAWLLTALHILPVAFVSFAAAMVHRSAVEAEAKEHEAHEAQRRREERERAALELRMAEDERARAAANEQRRAAWLLEQEAQDRELQRKIEAARVKVELSKSRQVEASDKAAVTAPQSAGTKLGKAERQEALLTLIDTVGAVNKLDITATAERFGVSRQTVYNDLEALKNAGKL